MECSRFKFRAWYKKDEEYLDPDYYEGFYMSPDGVVHAGITEWNGICDHYQEIPQEQLIIEQCTGLLDKNGKLIFEGDVVRYYRSTAMCLGGERIAQVLWDERDAEFGILTTLGDGYNMWEALRFGIEIIGNIHEMELEK